MAEGWVNHDLQEQWVASSAGTKPSGYVHPMAVRAMAELGINISQSKSQSIEDFRDRKFDLVVTVCDSAAEECPIWLGEGQVVHISFPDPAEATGSDEERMKVFRSVRDDIRRRIIYFLENGRILDPGIIR